MLAGSLFKWPYEADPVADLVVRVAVVAPTWQDTAADPDGPIYRVGFSSNAFRVLDEGGLPDFGQMADAQGRRRAATTFRSRNHAWAKESFVSFSTTDGWSYVIVTGWDCVEVVGGEPQVTLEQS